MDVITMRLRLHFPSLIDIPDGWNALQRERLQQVAVQAFERALTTLDIPGAQIEFVHTLQEKRARPASRSVPQNFTRRSAAVQPLDTATSVYIPSTTKHDTQSDITQQRNTPPGVLVSSNNDLRRATNTPPDITQQRNTRPG